MTVSSCTRLALAAAVLAAATALSAASVSAQTGSLGGPPDTAPGEGTVWLCQPGVDDDPCGGRTDAPVDCFYVYPTVTRQRGENANLTKAPELYGVALAQAAPFAQHCNVWAPVYQQSTLKGLATQPGPERTASLNVAYDDIEDAWRDYLANHNNGRGVILIGHSQGTRMLRTLIHNEIDGKPVQAQLVSALLMGGDVLVREGSTVGGDFTSVPGCTSPGQIGCVIAYSVYAHIPHQPRYGSSPPVPGLSGTRADLPWGPGYEVLCTNPASLDRNDAAPVHGFTLAGRTTEFTAQCTKGDGPRLLTIVGPGARLLPTIPHADWGLHMLDVNLTQRTLVNVVGAQVAAYTSR